jgi:hypothetical protein
MTRQDKIRQDKQDKIRQDQTRQNKIRQGKTMQDKTRQDEIRQEEKFNDKHKTRQDKTRQNKTRQIQSQDTDTKQKAESKSTFGIMCTKTFRNKSCKVGVRMETADKKRIGATAQDRKREVGIEKGCDIKKGFITGQMCARYQK